LGTTRRAGAFSSILEPSLCTVTADGAAYHWRARVDTAGKSLPRKTPSRLPR